VGFDFVLTKTSVELGFEDLDLLLGNLGPTQPAYQLVGLAAEHRPGDNFDPPAGVSHVRIRLQLTIKTGGL
jgi:hypothetical protein